MKKTASQRALLYLAEADYAGMDANSVGGAVWPDGPPGGGKGASAKGGGYYAAQMLLGRLKKAGLVEHAASEGSARWRLSTRGRHAVSTMISTVSAKEPEKPHAGGMIVAASDPCTCGCAPEDHGRDPEYPGSTSCTGCDDCIAYEADPGALEGED